MHSALANLTWWATANRRKSRSKGESGNKNGRRKGAKNIATALNEALGEKRTVVKNGSRQRLSKSS